jgi:hypothetical protein
MFNCSKIVFGPALLDWSAVSNIGLFDAASSGNLLTWGPLDVSATIKEDQQFILVREELSSILMPLGIGSDSRWTQYLQEQIVNMVFRATSFTQPFLHAGLSNTAPTFSGGNVTEPSGGYGRTSPLSWYTPTQESGGAVSTNSSSGDFGTATTNWGAQSYALMYDASSGGNLLAYGLLSVQPPIVTGDHVTVAAGSNATTGPLKFKLF